MYLKHERGNYAKEAKYKTYGGARSWRLMEDECGEYWFHNEYGADRNRGHDPDIFERDVPEHIPANKACACDSDDQEHRKKEHQWIAPFHSSAFGTCKLGAYRQYFTNDDEGQCGSGLKHLDFDGFEEAWEGGELDDLLRRVGGRADDDRAV
jgi:hypothetical protein